MKESIQNSDDNLVMFPAAKNFPVEENISDELMMNDPLEALMNEFSHIPNEDFYDEDELSEEEPVEQKLGQLDRILLIHNQLKKLEDTTQRMKYLIDEIEDFIPKKVRRS